MPFCAHCRQSYTPPIYRNTVCSSCGKELKTCRNCGHFSPGMANDCREPVSERVTEKDRGNFCDWFISASDISRTSGNNGNKFDASKEAFANLFGDE